MEQLSLIATVPPRRRSYHVQRPIPGDPVSAAAEIAAGERRANAQEAAVLEFFRANPGRWTPSEVCGRVGGMLLTSARRSLTTMTYRGVLRCTSERRPGPFGRPEHCWELAAERKAA